ncbi:MAG TPA: DinB family protein [Candidatus Angelobacter sp.]|nr:DinB family protein [Candidatus Angelobacter sp.]
MSQITIDQAKFLLAGIISHVKAEHQTTMRVIEAIPAENSDYRPDPSAKTALELAWHIVASEKRFCNAVKAGAFDFTALPRPETVRNGAEIAAWSEANFSEDLKALEGLSGEQLVKIVDFRGMFQRPAFSYLQVMLNHTIHHRGQLSTYLRPMGGKVPSIYGESYDAAQARLAREAKAS